MDGFVASEPRVDNNSVDTIILLLYVICVIADRPRHNKIISSTSPSPLDCYYLDDIEPRNTSTHKLSADCLSDNQLPATSQNSGSQLDTHQKSANKIALQLRTDLFRPYPASFTSSLSALENNSNRPNPMFDGLISVHIFSGRGVQANTGGVGYSSDQELYCVVAVDGVCRARTAVQSAVGHGVGCFDWDDRFIVDIYQSSGITFGIYIYDGRGGRHRLANTGSISMTAVFGHSDDDLDEPPRRHRLAVRLEPRGLLYVELCHHGPARTFSRTPNVESRSIFGVNISSIQSDIPSIVEKCIKEIERRGGLRQIGIYQLCGSAKRAQRLRNELEVQGPDIMNTNNVFSAVGDINVVTGKHFSLYLHVSFTNRSI